MGRAEGCGGEVERVVDGLRRGYECVWVSAREMAEVESAVCGVEGSRIRSSINMIPCTYRGSWIEFPSSHCEPEPSIPGIMPRGSAAEESVPIYQASCSLLYSDSAGDR